MGETPNAPHTITSHGIINRERMGLFLEHVTEYLSENGRHYTTMRRARLKYADQLPV